MGMNENIRRVMVFDLDKAQMFLTKLFFFFFVTVLTFLDRGKHEDILITKEMQSMIFFSGRTAWYRAYKAPLRSGSV